MAQSVKPIDTLLQTVFDHISERDRTLHTLPVTPSASDVSKTIAALPAHLPEKGRGTEQTLSYLLSTLLPGCLTGQAGPRYFGFVVGGVTPAAQLADILASSYDENVSVTLPGVTASTAIEQRTLEMVLDLLNIDRGVYRGRTITTGATASNVLGLACARDYLYSVSPHLAKGYSYNQDGPPSAPGLPSPPIVLLSLHPHFSIQKAASLVGLGAGPKVIHSIPAAADDELAFDLLALEARLAEEQKIGRGVIVCYGLGEVNTGGFGSGLDRVSELCRDFGAWLHVDAAFGGFASAVPELRHLVKGIDMADSLTLDGHKWLNVPYDCGLFYTKTPSLLMNVFAPPASAAPAYLSFGSDSTAATARPSTEIIPELVPTPLYVNVENSRRFRALPLFASLFSLGRDGYAGLIRENIAFACKVAEYIEASPHYQLMNRSPHRNSKGNRQDPIVPLNIVLFCGSESSAYPPSDPSASVKLTKAINDTRRLYVSGTKWRGQGAVRIAVSNWRTGRRGQEDLDIVCSVLDAVMQA